MEKIIKSPRLTLTGHSGWVILAFVAGIPFTAYSQGGFIRQPEIVKSWYDEGHSLLKEIYNVKDLSSRIMEGEYKSYYLNGKPKAQGYYINNQPDGIWTYYYENGEVKMRGRMKKNSSLGLWKYYFENGQISMEGELKKDIRDGYWKFYYESGLIKSEGGFSGGVKSGIWNYYYEDGTLKAQAFVNGNWSVYKEFYTSGNVKMRGYQIDGKSDSAWTYYYESGKIKAEGAYSGGVKQNHWVYYNEDGNKASEGDYDNGNQDGKWTYYYDNGNISSEGEEKNGKRDGYWKLYNPQGEFKGDGTFESGSGVYKEYYSNGNLKISGQMADDLNEGKWLYYYEDGTKEGECDFVKGEGTYTGYYSSGEIKMKGTIKDGKNVGNWELYASDGTLSGYYHPVYENDKPVFKVLSKSTVTDTLPHDNEKPEYLYKNRKSRYFTPVINEYQGIILATNPFSTIIGKLPVSVEYYKQERLGHELQIGLIRSPFYGNHKTLAPNSLYKFGFDVAIREKLYNKEKGFGMLYIANELRYTFFEHSFNSIDSVDLPAITMRKIDATEQRYEYSLIVGNRWIHLFGNWMIREKKQNGITLDIFAGLGIGYRLFEKKYGNNPDYDKIFGDLHQEKISLSPRFGINLGYVF